MAASSSSDVKRGEPQAKLYTRIDGRDALLFDPIALDPSGKTRIGAVVPNRDATRLAVGVYAQGTERKDFRIIDSTTGAQIGPVITGLDSFGWARDERYAFITPRTAESDAKQEPMRCLRHRLGGERGDDELLLAVSDAKNYCSVYEPEEADVTVFETGDFWSNTIRIRPLGSTAEPRTIYASDKYRAEGIFKRDRMYFRTNDNAANWKLMAASLRPAGVQRLDDAHCASRRVSSTMRRSRARGSSRRRARTCCRSSSCTTWPASAVRELALPEFGNVSGIAYDIDADRGYATLASFTAPYKVYGFEGKSLEWNLVWQDDPPLDLSQIVATRVYVPARGRREDPGVHRAPQGSAAQRHESDAARTSTAASTSASSRSTSAAIRRSSTAAACSSMPAFAAAASTARSGTSRRCSRRSRRRSTTRSPSPNG